MENTMSETKKNDITPVKFKLDADHTHAGVDHKKGETITLRKHQADRLQKAGTGKIVNA